MQNLVKVYSFKFCEIFKDIYFVNVYEDLPLKNKIFTRVSFRKILGFYYKGWYTYDLHFKRGWGVSECSGRPGLFFFLLKKMDLHHVQTLRWGKH